VFVVDRDGSSEGTIVTNHGGDLLVQRKEEPGRGQDIWRNNGTHGEWAFPEEREDSLVSLSIQYGIN
jgi:hypothetical protein